MPPCCILALEKRIYLWVRLYERRYKFEVSSQLIYQLNGMQEMVCRKWYAGNGMQETFARAAYFESDKFYEYAAHDRTI
jgi:hypothetical protein